MTQEKLPLQPVAAAVRSIKQLVTYAAGLIERSDVEVLDLNDYELPLFSVDREDELGQPELAQDFLEKITA